MLQRWTRPLGIWRLRVVCVGDGCAIANKAKGETVNQALTAATCLAIDETWCFRRCVLTYYCFFA